MAVSPQVNFSIKNLDAEKNLASFWQKVGFSLIQQAMWDHGHRVIASDNDDGGTSTSLISDLRKTELIWTLLKNENFALLRELRFGLVSVKDQKVTFFDEITTEERAGILLQQEKILRESGWIKRGPSQMPEWICIWILAVLSHAKNNQIFTDDLRTFFDVKGPVAAWCEGQYYIKYFEMPFYLPIGIQGKAGPGQRNSFKDAIRTNALRAIKASRSARGLHLGAAEDRALTNVWTAYMHEDLFGTNPQKKLISLITRSP